MSRRIRRKFEALAQGNRKALVPFITAGDPSLEATVPVMHALVRAGADVIELGVPFSDPMADGPSIQRSSERAIERGAGLRYVLRCVAEFRKDDGSTPVVLMGYLNPIEILGAQAFARDAAAAGVDGVLLVDLPPEEAGPTREAFNAAGIELICSSDIEAGIFITSRENGVWALLPEVADQAIGLAQHGQGVQARIGVAVIGVGLGVQLLPVGLQQGHDQGQGRPVGMPHQC